MPALLLPSLHTLFMFLIITPPGKKDGALRHLTDEETEAGKVNSTFEKQQSWDWPQGGI